MWVAYIDKMNSHMISGHENVRSLIKFAYPLSTLFNYILLTPFECDIVHADPYLEHLIARLNGKFLKLA